MRFYVILLMIMRNYERMLNTKMAMIDTYRNNIIRKRQELAKLQSDKASEAKKIAGFNSKINSADQAIGRTKSVRMYFIPIR